MPGTRTKTTSLWALIERMQTRLEGEGHQAPVVDAAVTWGLRSDASAGMRRLRKQLRVGAALLGPEPGQA